MNTWGQLKPGSDASISIVCGPSPLNAESSRSSAEHRLSHSCAVVFMVTSMNTEVSNFDASRMSRIFSYKFDSGWWREQNTRQICRESDKKEGCLGWRSVGNSGMGAAQGKNRVGMRRLAFFSRPLEGAHEVFDLLLCLASDRLGVCYAVPDEVLPKSEYT